MNLKRKSDVMIYGCKISIMSGEGTVPDPVGYNVVALSGFCMYRIVYAGSHVVMVDHGLYSKWRPMSWKVTVGTALGSRTIWVPTWAVSAGLSFSPTTKAHLLVVYHSTLPLRFRFLWVVVAIRGRGGVDLAWCRTPLVASPYSL